MKTLSDLKRKLQPGQRVSLVYRYKKLDVPIEKEVLELQSNGIALAKEIRDGRAWGKSWLTWPKASLLECVGEPGLFSGFRIYSTGKRPLTCFEKEIRDGYEKTRDTEQERRDMSDGSTSYWQKLHYYRERNAEYLIGNIKQHGMRYDYNSGLVWDDRVKGELCLEYVFV